ncbi:unc-45 like b [Fusarium pseudoanthophilum]|uniref:Unc-45 like b n=1 Tax=Fusarium pseudoanthophilum TaxID=48495 RepID=A0A8H5KYP6_9HYPO|nr:unc-45 like b [Fusarium pseudoanthophilum]
MHLPWKRSFLCTSIRDFPSYLHPLPPRLLLLQPLLSVFISLHHQEFPILSHPQSFFTLHHQQCSRSNAAVTNTMDLIDISLDQNLVKFVKATEAILAEAQTKKGQLVTDHPTKDAVEQLFMARVLGKAILTPGLNPAGAFVRMACGSDYPFPNSKLIEDYLAIPITTVEGPYPPCAIPEKDLKPISISEMRLETHHWGSKVLLHQLSPVDRGEAIMFIVEDQAGTAVLLKLYHQPLEKEISCNWTMLDYRVCIVKNPFFQRVHDTITPNFCQIPQPYYTLRVDHPGDIIPLRHGDGRIPEAWKVNPDRDDKTSHGYRDLGNKAVSKKDWAAAHHSYSQALDVAEAPQDKQLAHLNRSLTNLKLGRPAEALLDVTQAYDPEAPTEKALFRHATALYRLNRFEDCEAMLIDLLDKFPDSKAAETTLLSVKTRLTEQRTGKYNFNKMYKTAKAAKGAALIDCATYSKPVEIRESPGRGRGLFTTKAVKAGDLLLVEKAFEYSFIDETRVTDQCTVMVNFNTKRMTAGASAHLWPKVVQKLYHDPEALSAFTELHHGKYKPVTATEADGRPVVDAFLVEKILSLNSFGAPRSTRDFCGNNVWSGNPAPEVCASTRERPLFTSVGVWLLAARINHSCVGNCRRSFIGDMAIIRAARDIPADTELTIPYRPSTNSESYQDVQKGLARWGFKCDCELCKDRLKTTEAVRVRRKELSKEFNKQLPSDQEFDLDKATKLLRVIEKTYSGKPAKQIRWCIADLYAYVGIRCRQDGDFVRAAEMLIKGLETMGFVILATPPDDGSARARFEVKQWGMMEHHIPWLFFQLIECYDEINPHLVPVAEHYAQLAYSIIVGEGDSMWDVMPATGNKAERT